MRALSASVGKRPSASLISPISMYRGSCAMTCLTLACRREVAVDRPMLIGWAGLRGANLETGIFLGWMTPDGAVSRLVVDELLLPAPSRSAAGLLFLSSMGGAGAFGAALEVVLMSFWWTIFWVLGFLAVSGSSSRLFLRAEAKVAVGDTFKVAEGVRGSALALTCSCFFWMLMKGGATLSFLEVSALVEGIDFCPFGGFFPFCSDFKATSSRGSVLPWSIFWTDPFGVNLAAFTAWSISCFLVSDGTAPRVESLLSPSMHLPQMACFICWGMGQL